MKSFFLLFAIFASPAFAQPVWEQVVGAPPGLLNGFGDPNNNSVRSMIVFDGMLYVGTENGNNGLELWRSNDGIGWIQVNENGFGVTTNRFAGSMAVFGGVSGNWYNDSGAEVWQSGEPEWVQRNVEGFGNAANTWISSLVVFDDQLFAGTSNRAAGCEVWRLKSELVPIFTDGFGPGNTSAWSASVP